VNNARADQFCKKRDLYLAAAISVVRLRYSPTPGLFAFHLTGSLTPSFAKQPKAAAQNKKALPLIPEQ
jgi:hypothetical protein